MRTTSRVAFLLATTALLAPTLAPDDAGAQENTGQMTISATVPGECTMGTIEDLDFGTIGPGQTNVDSDADIEFSCTSSTTVDIAIDLGVNASSGAINRELANPATTTHLTYLLSQDSTHATAWGDDNVTIPGDPKRVTTSGTAPQIETIYGRIPFTNGVQTGTYSDTVTITLNVVG